MQMEARYRGLFEAAPDAMVVVNPGGQIVLLNVHGERQFGYRRDELIGQEVRIIIPEGFAERLLSDRLRFAAGTVAPQIGAGIELVGRRKDGTNFPIEIMLSVLASDDGHLVTAAIRDIGIRKAAERRLMQMEATYRGVLEAAPDAMVVVTSGGEIVLLNIQAARQFGYGREEMLGLKVTTIIPKGFAESLISDAMRSAEDASAQQTGAGIELTGRRKDGREFPIELILSPLKSGEGTMVTAAIRDITERKRDEVQLLLNAAELDRSNKELEAFTYSVSHDLRTPLRHIEGFSKLLLEQPTSGLSETARSYLQDVRESTVCMSHMLDELLALARLGRKRLAPQVTSLQSIVEDVVTELKKTNQERVIEWKIGELPFVECDPGLVTQVFLNLLSNAVKFTRPRELAVIEIGANFENGRPTIFVADNGVGFNMKNASKLFGVFQRLHRQEEFEGTGVGLATVQRIINKHGGEVWAAAAADGGAKFLFTLGVAPGQSADPSPIGKRND